MNCNTDIIFRIIIYVDLHTMTYEQSIKLHDVTFQKDVILTVSAVKT
jgi:hypothetical protein